MEAASASETSERTYYDIRYDMIYLLTAIGLSPGGSTHLHTNNTQNNTNDNQTTQITTNVKQCGPCPVFASFTLAFALQRRKKHGKTSVRLRKTCHSTVYILPKHLHITKPTQTHTFQNPHKRARTHTHYKTLTNTHITKPTQARTHAHTLQKI
jgi:hypothetical protein